MNREQRRKQSPKKGERAAAYLMVDIGAGEGIEIVREQLDAFDREIAKGRNLMFLYADVITDERVEGFGDKAVECAQAIQDWLDAHPQVDGKGGPTITIKRSL